MSGEEALRWLEERSAVQYVHVVLYPAGERGKPRVAIWFEPTGWVRGDSVADCVQQEIARLEKAASRPRVGLSAVVVDGDF